jgi:hypothetical protein
MQATLSQYTSRPLVDDIESSRYKTNLDLLSEMEASVIQEPAIIRKENKENRRKFRNAKDDICNFF